jgi:hypothetical protein
MAVPYLLWMQSICQRDAALGREYLIVTCTIGAELTSSFSAFWTNGMRSLYCMTFAYSSVRTQLASRRRNRYHRRSKRLYEQSSNFTHESWVHDVQYKRANPQYIGHTTRRDGLFCLEHREHGLWYTSEYEQLIWGRFQRQWWWYLCEYVTAYTRKSDMLIKIMFSAVGWIWCLDLLLRSWY